MRGVQDLAHPALAPHGIERLLRLELPERTVAER